VLLPAGISGGVRNSIRTGIGYAGIVIAALAALSYAGFNLSSVAIIAGALSVGIGFGLQNLVNNFISGLILLVERPISVGDLVVVGGEEGCVRKISVRSTELETFDGANVLIPNSYFISEKVKNWTFRNKVRRVAIPIGVAYGSDPRRVPSRATDGSRGQSRRSKNTRTSGDVGRILPRKYQFYSLHVCWRHQQSRERSHAAIDGNP